MSAAGPDSPTMPGRILSIESATDWLSIALLEGEQVVCLRVAEGTRRHAAALLPLVEAGLAEAGWRVEDLEALAISTGPGSFTSLRIGLATAKGLAFGRGLRAVGVSTLEAMALGAFETAAGLDAAGKDPEVLALLDARRGEWYAGSWVAGASAAGEGAPRGGLVPRLSEGLYAPAELAGDLSRPVVACSPERAGWREAFAAAGLEIVATVEGEAARPRADRVGRLGARRLAAGEGEPVEALGARYLRRAEAEAQRLGRPVEAGELARVDEAARR